MTTSPSAIIETPQRSVAASLYRQAYRLFAYFGLFSIYGVLLWGFRYDAAAASANYGFNVALYAIFIVPHLILTRTWFKKRVWGNPAGHPRERRFYIFLTVVTWLGIIALHRPLSGGEIVYPEAWAKLITFIGLVFFLMFMKLFFEGVTFAAIDGLLGVPGGGSAFSHGPETPLFTEGRYAQVRHPMYQAFLLAMLASLVIHPNVAQLFFGVTVGLSFILFIPVEEAQMIRARGDDYREYKKQTRWRLFPGIW